MYECPINLAVQNITTQLKEKEEQMILEATRIYDVAVDREELIKALKYDRNQYSKGYKDGTKDILDKIRTEIEEVGGTWGLRKALEIIDKYKAESEDKK